MTKTLRVRRGSYVDSVALMQLSRQVAALPGVSAALVAMTTELNLELARTMGFGLPGRTSPNEMLVAIDADSEQALDAALAQVDFSLRSASAPTTSSFAAAPAPRTVAAAARGSEATVALISTPGAYAFADAMDALDAGLHTMIFSDNLPVEQEVALKRYAETAGVLVMGPDCGTAVVGGVGLGFANVVRPGPVGIVAASGTGAQHLMTLLAAADVGVSHCLGVGGRDLTAAVGGLSTMRALDLLAADDDTELIAVVSKPPAEDVARAVRAHAGRIGKPVLFGFLARSSPDLTATARRVAEAVGREWKEPEHWPGAVKAGRAGGFLRGLFAGGTLCDEAMLLAAPALGPIASNIPLQPAWAVEETLASRGHTMIDFGDDRLTQGRPHPMIDGSLRRERLEAEIDDPDTAVLLLDVVLGQGTAADPAGELAEPLARAVAAGIPVVVSLVGTPDDPQGLESTTRRLCETGAGVYRSNAFAARTAVRLVGAA